MRIFDEKDQTPEPNHSDSKEQDSVSDVELSVEYEYGENKFRASGKSHDVNMHAAAFLSSLGYVQPTSGQKPLISKGNPDQLPLFAENDTPSLADDDVSPEEPISAEKTPIDLVTFYLKKSPQGQYQQVAVITYWYQKCRGAESLELVSYDDYANAYTILRRAAVAMPTDVKGSVRNTHNRTDYIYSPSHGNFAITVPGEQFVETLGTQE